MNKPAPVHRAMVAAYGEDSTPAKDAMARITAAKEHTHVPLSRLTSRCAGWLTRRGKLSNTPRRPIAGGKGSSRPRWLLTLQERSSIQRRGRLRRCKKSTSSWAMELPFRLPLGALRRRDGWTLDAYSESMLTRPSRIWTRALPVSCISSSKRACSCSAGFRRVWKSDWRNKGQLWVTVFHLPSSLALGKKILAAKPLKPRARVWTSMGWRRGARRTNDHICCDRKSM